MELNEFVANFAEQLEIENVEALTADTNFRDLEEWSSLSVMILIAFYDVEFGKEIGGTDIKKCQTIQDLYDLAIA